MTSKALDYETQEQHKVIVTAFDAAPDSRSSTATVTINVQDVQDMIPVFPQKTYNSQVPENENDYLVAEIEVTFFIF